MLERIIPLITGPTLWPMSMVVARNPSEEPIRVDGTCSQIRGDVDEITIANPSP